MSNPIPDPPPIGAITPDAAVPAICPTCGTALVTSIDDNIRCEKCGYMGGTVSPASRVIGALSQVTKPGFWTIGTLTYTAGGLVLLFAWLLWGDFALSMRDRSIGPLTEILLLRQGADNSLKQTLTVTIPTLIGLLISPIVSYKSDRLRGRWGRRIPFLAIPAPLAALALIGLAFSPQLGRYCFTLTGHAPVAGETLEHAARTYTLTIFTILWSIYQVIAIVAGSVLGGLINDVVPRSMLGRFGGLFRAVSLYDGILFNAILLQYAEMHFTLMMALIALLFGAGFLLMCLKVKEGQYPPPPPEDPNLSESASGGIGWMVAFVRRFILRMGSYLKECFSQPYYVLCFAMFTCGALTFRPFNDFTIRYAAQLHVPYNYQGTFVGISYFISLIIAFPLGMLVDRFHAMRMAIVSMSLYVLTALFGAFFVTSATTFAIALVLHTVLSGTYFTCTQYLAQTVLPRSKFTQYASASDIVTRLAGLVVGQLLGVVLDLTNSYYRLTWWLGFILATLTLLATIVVYWRFMKLGGPDGYVAPGDVGERPQRREPPKHMWMISGVYLLGAAVGIGLGGVIAFLLAHNRTPTFASFLALNINNKSFLGLTTFIMATVTIPFGILGAVMGGKLANRRGT